MPWLTTNDIAANTGEKPSRVANFAEELVKLGYIRKHKRKRGATVFRVKQVAIVAIGRALALPTDVHDVDLLRRQFADERTAKIEAERRGLEARAKNQRLVQKNHDLRKELLQVRAQVTTDGVVGDGW